jgi:predicted secreted hydrolase
MRRWWLMLVMPVIAVACGQQVPERTAPPPSRGLRFLGGDSDDGFERARVVRDFVFPADHGSHSGFRTEWWYFTGNLATATGRHFGFELTFFRYALAASSAPRANASAWRSEQVWMAHFAITDTANGRFIARERLTREVLDLAGAQTDPLRVWVKDWSATGEPTDEDLVLRLQARDEDVALALRLASSMPPVAQGDRGLDAKGAGDGNASYYYSIPRLVAEGDVTIGGETVAVTGLAWLDREWSTSSLEPGTAGWDWFALHLSDGGNLMFYRLRTAEGTASAFSGGSLVRADGMTTRLGASDVEVVAVGYWTSKTGVRYPTSWRLAAPSLGIALEIDPYLANQELDLSVRYWEGAVRAAGIGPEGPLTAQGYLELAGY